MADIAGGVGFLVLGALSIPAGIFYRRLPGPWRYYDQRWQLFGLSAFGFAVGIALLIR